MMQIPDSSRANPQSVADEGSHSSEQSLESEDIIVIESLRRKSSSLEKK
jgi:hypothetical protein